MTKEMQELIDRELNAALESDDAKLVERALINSQRALIDCQRKTAERVKDLVARADATSQRVKGAQAILAILRYVVAMGGGAAIVKLLAAS